jgi:hypothetical protein
MLPSSRPVRAAGQEELPAEYRGQGNLAVFFGPSEERGPRVGVGPREH